MDIHEIINKIYPMPESSVDKLKRLLSKVTYPKGHLILETGKTETNLFFYRERDCKGLYPCRRQRSNLLIGGEGSTIVSLKSYVNNQQGYETVELMENSVLYMLKRKELYELFEKIYISPTGDANLQKQNSCKQRKGLSPLLFTTASERYRELLKDNPDLLQRMPLECLASYLGITPVSLSRIRAKLKRSIKIKFNLFDKLPQSGYREIENALPNYFMCR